MSSLITDFAAQKPAGKLGLSSVAYDPASSTICICSSAAQESPWLIDRSSPGKATKVERDKFSPFPGEQIQCAVIVPGTVPEIIMVNHSNKIFALKFEHNRWRSQPINVQIDKDRGEIVSADEKISMAAMDCGSIRLFWMHGQEGRMLTIKTNEDHEDRHVYQTNIMTPF